MIRQLQTQTFFGSRLTNLVRSTLLVGLLLAPISHAMADSVFSISPDGREVTDSRTGLTWQRCPVGMYWSDELATCDGSPTYVMWYEALHVAVNLARSEQLPWRVPSVKELASILDRSVINPAIDEQIFPDTPNHQFWSSTPYRLDAFFAWLVDFYDGAVLYSYLEDLSALRLVRDTPR